MKTVHTRPNDLANNFKFGKHEATRLPFSLRRLKIMCDSLPNIQLCFHFLNCDLLAFLRIMKEI